MKNKLSKILLSSVLAFSLVAANNSFAIHWHGGGFGGYHGWHGGWGGYRGFHGGWGGYRGWNGGWGGGFYGRHWRGGGWGGGVNPWLLGGLIMGIGSAGYYNSYPYGGYGYGPYYGGYGGYGPYYGGYGAYYPRYYGYRYCRLVGGHYDPYGYWIPRQRVCWVE